MATEKLKGNYRDKFLYMLWLLKTQSSKENPLSTQTIQRELGKKGILIDRRTLSKEMQLIRDMGLLPIVFTKDHHQLAYYLKKQEFNETELNQIANAIQAVNFITEDETKSLLDKINAYGQLNDQDISSNQFVCYNIFKQPNNELFNNIIKLQKGIKDNCQAIFYYFDYDKDGEKVYRKNKKLYKVDPIAIVFNEGFYYLICYSEKYASDVTYRIDRMDELSILPDKINIDKALDFMRNYVDSINGKESECDMATAIEAYVKQSFKMYAGVSSAISLKFPKTLLGAFYDKFGLFYKGKKRKIAKETEDGMLSATVKVQTSDSFWAWVAGFGGEMQITGNNRAKDNYKKFCQKVLNSIK